jgi:hypothetical protein
VLLLRHAWRQDYNMRRPDGSLSMRASAVFAAEWTVAGNTALAV